MKYFLVVGEASGDLHASGLMVALRRKDDDPTFAYMGGAYMRAQGGTCVVRSEDMAFMGFVDVLKNYRTIRDNARKVQDFLRSYQPDILICVDYAGFCFRYILPLARQELSTTLIVYYIPPKVWAWKKKRIKMLRSHTHMVLTIFPFEVPFFEREKLPNVRYVGNPSLEQIQRYERTSVGTTAPADTPYIAILCGSRVSEIRKNLPRMLEVCSAFPHYEVIIAGAPGVDASLYAPIIGDESRVRLLFGQTYDIVRYARAALVTSGTATLETALLGTPQVVCYSVAGGYLANFVFRNFFTVPYISLVNLIAGREVVPELYGGLFTADRIISELTPLLSDTPERAAMLQGYRYVRNLLSTPAPAATTAADVMHSALS